MDEEPEIIDFRKRKEVPWKAFEREVHAFLRRSVQEGSSGLTPSTATVLLKPKYYSNDRKATITFDVSIEVRPLEAPDQLLFLWIIECKDYLNNVPVDDVEEFKSKLEQVRAHKGTMFTRIGFDPGAIEYAVSHRIGLALLRKEECITLKASATGGMFGEILIATPSFHDSDVGECEDLYSLLAKVLGRYGVLVLPANLGERRITSVEGEWFFAPQKQKNGPR